MKQKSPADLLRIFSFSENRTLRRRCISPRRRTCLAIRRDEPDEPNDKIKKALANAKASLVAGTGKSANDEIEVVYEMP
jgi:hypothetical protein